MHLVTIRGSGRVVLPAYGLADAEHQVEKEVRAAWPQGTVDVLDVGRSASDGQIVEEFTVRYRVRGTVAVAEPGVDEARRAALRMLRERFAGTRYERIAWEWA